MTTSAKPEEKPKQPEQTEGQKGAPSSFVDPEVIKKINESLAIPIPSKDKFWEMESLVAPGKKRDKKILGIFKKKDLNDEEVAELRKAAVQAPGNTRTRIQKLKKQYPDNSTLFMLSAICTHGMVMNSSNQQQIVKGLKNATKDAALCLLSDGISVYNCDNFFKIYFIMIDRFKRSQIRNYETVRHDPRLEKYKTQLTTAMHLCDFLSQDKSKANNIVAHLKKKLKTSLYPTILSFHDIKKACQHIEQNQVKEQMAMGTASEVIAFVYALCIAFARIPILWKLLDCILELIPTNSKVLYLRRTSIYSVKLFTQYKMATIESDREQMKKIAMTIAKENVTAMQKMDGQSIYQVYESDPFFNMAFIAEMTHGLFEPKEQAQMINTALKAVESVIQRDMSKNHVFTESANNHTHKLGTLRDAIMGKSEGSSENAAPPPSED